MLRYPGMRGSVLTLAALGAAAILAAAMRDGSSGASAPPRGEMRPTMSTQTAAPGGRIVKTDAEWKKVLTEEQYNILRKGATERAFTGAYWKNHARGTYVCAADGNPLFSSETKFESGTGWPSFWAPISPGAVETREDNSFFMHRTEVLCGRCGGHLGHVFDDGPAPTHLRYCMNSGAMKFIPAK